MYSDLNYATPKMVRTVFGLTERDYLERAKEGRFVFLTRYQRSLITMDSLSSFYRDRENLVAKRWGYDYESPEDKYGKMLDTQLKGFPRCFFRCDAPDGYYRILHREGAMKICMYVFGGYARCICFSRGKEDELFELYRAYDEGRIDWEG